MLKIIIVWNSSVDVIYVQINSCQEILQIFSNGFGCDTVSAQDLLRSLSSFLDNFIWKVVLKNVTIKIYKKL